MAAVDDQAQVVAALDQILAEQTEPRIRAFQRTVADPAFHVVGQLHHAEAERLVGVEQVEIVLDRVRALEMEHDSQVTGLFGVLDVGGTAGQTQTVMALDEPMPAPEDAQRLFRRLADRDGRDDGGQPAVHVVGDIGRVHQKRADPVDDDGVAMQRQGVFGGLSHHRRGPACPPRLGPGRPRPRPAWPW